MANNPLEGMTDEFFEQILFMPGYANSSSETSDPAGGLLQQMGHRTTFPGSIFPLGLSLEQGNGGFIKPDSASGSNSNRFSDDAHRNSTTTVNSINPNANHSRERDAAEPGGLFPAFGNAPSAVRPVILQSGQGAMARQTFHGQSTSSVIMAHPPAAPPRARARRGQATDPHSISERLRRERIAEKIKQLQDLVPNCNKTDRAAMLDEIMDYVKFLRLQVNVLSMSRLAGTGSAAQLVGSVPCPTVEGDENGTSSVNEQVWDKWLSDGTEQHVAKLMREDVGAAMQFLQSKNLCLLPISLAMAIYNTNQPTDVVPAGAVKSEPNTN